MLYRTLNPSTHHRNLKKPGQSPQQKSNMSMFGALNRFISRLDAAPLNDNHNHHQSATNGAYGFQVLRNTNPEIPLEPWFDFVIGINGRTIVSLFVCFWWPLGGKRSMCRARASKGQEQGQAKKERGWGKDGSNVALRGRRSFVEDEIC